MNLFLSTYVNSIDKKGRISIPSTYRNIISQQESFNGVIAYPSIKHNAIELCGYGRIAELSKIIQSLDPYSEERDAFEAVILGASVQLSFDSEGRIVIPKHLKEYAKIEDQACFVGKGMIFEIWNVEDFATYMEAAKHKAQTNRLLLKNV
jgi:MraZ protein